MARPSRFAQATTLPGSDRRVQPDAEEPIAVPRDNRYQVLGRLGVGGMGEVHLCYDRVVGRSVALKVLDPRRAASAEIQSRFVREARVQGNLEHPAVVPLYDLGRDARGVTFFTMKRIVGLTLEEVIDGVARHDSELARRFPRRRLLEVFRQVCQGIEFSHGRGVIHRDLKPGNVMVGDFGEVYVLDWGLAKLKPSSPGLAALRGQSATTMTGHMMGTPGYMSPEQAIGSEIDERADVYSLGALLFELLALEPLHNGRSGSELLRSTHLGADARASVRAPDRDIAPELDAICVRATAQFAEDRYGSVREMREAVEAFLEGARDVELRKHRARTHAENAVRAADISRSLQDPAQRNRALSEAGRALALDPENPVAQDVLMSLVLEPPPQMPPEVARALQAEVDEEARIACRVGLVGFGAFLPPVFFAMLEAKDMRWFLVLTGAVVGAIALCAVGARLSRASAGVLTAIALFSSIAIASVSGMYGALVLVPTLAAAHALALNIGAIRSLRWIPLATGCLAVLVPALLEWAGVLPTAYVFRDETWVILAVAVEFPTAPYMLPVVSLLALVAPALIVWRLDERLAEASRRVHVQLWHVGAFLPRRSR